MLTVISCVMNWTKYTVCRRNEGFTLIEMMINLSIITLIMSLLPLIYIHIFQFSGKSTDHFDVNHAMFQKELNEELKTADYVEVLNQQLYIHKDKNVITYLFHNQRLVRKLNGQGYIIMLEGVKNAKFEEQNNTVYLSIERYKKATLTYQIV